MNLLLFTPGERLAGDRVGLQGRRLAHLVEVHRAREGDEVRVGEVGGLTGRGRILELGTDRALLAVALSEAPPPKLPLCVVLALPRPKMLRRILRSVAEFGVPELHLIHSYRVEKSYWQTPVLHPGTVRQHLLQGLEQARDTVLPQIRCHRRFVPFVEDVLPGLIGEGTALLAHPGDHPPCPRQWQGPGVMVIGPEGGFIPYEVARLQEAGCDTVSLGPRILRVENALSAVLGRLL